MKLWGKYLYRMRGTVIWTVLAAICFGVMFALTGVDMRAVWYPLILIVVFGLGFLVAGFLRFRERQRTLQRILHGEGPYGEALPEPADLLEEDYRALVTSAEEAHRAEKDSWEAERKDTEDYYAVWVHQIKAPIAVMKVLLQQEDTRENQELASELFRIEQYADMALHYIRLGDDASDLVLQEYDLDGIIRKAIRKYAGQFIRKRLRLVYRGTDVRVLTDEKWLSFIIEQLLSNAVKYTGKGTITIEVNEKKQLSISDTGIGIAAEDLPRIFEKGFTGYNGRLDKKSTGIGLYLCRTAADKLGHRLTARSEPGQGSCFTIDLDSYPLQTE